MADTTTTSIPVPVIINGNNNNTENVVETLIVPPQPDIKLSPVAKFVAEEGNLTPASSGGEDEDAEDFHDMLKSDPTWIPPLEETETKIRNLLEQYFSDENLVKDKFLLKHVKRNKQGYVSVKLLTSFKKLKNLTRADWKTTAYCVRKSKDLVINKPGTKLKRLARLPEIDLPTTSIKTILYKCPEEMKEITLAQVTDHFQEFGKLTTIRTINPATEVPADLRNHMTKHPELGVTLCVVVEFETTDGAQNAFKTLSKLARDEGRQEFYCLLGSGRNPRKQRRGEYDSGDESGSPYVSSRENSPMTTRRSYLGNKNGYKNSPHLQVSPLVSPQGSRDASPERNCDSHSPRGSPRMQRRNQNSQANTSTSWRNDARDQAANNISPRVSPWSSPKSGRKQQHGLPKTSPLAIPGSLTAGETPGSGTSSPSGGSPWLQRKRLLEASQGNSPSVSPGSSPSMGRKFQDGVPEGVLRLPKGPPNHSTKGFDGIWKRMHYADVLAHSLKDLKAA